MIGYIVLGIVILFIIFILFRTLSFKPYKEEIRPYEEVKIDEEKIISNLQALVKCKTVSNYDKSLEDDKEFEKLISLLPKLYPNVFKVCEYTEFSKRALLFKWKGKDSTKNPAIMMAHFDVVPVDEENWDKPPFDGVIENNVLWGRGTLDTKVTFNGVLSAADKLIEEGFTPEADMYFAFSGQEEINGHEANDIVTWFEERKIEPEIVVDEGGAVVQDVFPGVKEPCGLIGIAEKGMMNLKFTGISQGGHASAPKPHTPIVELSRACTKIEDNPFKYHLTKPVAEMFDTLGRHSTFVYRMIFANLWIFKGVLNMICKKSGGEMNALMRTTVAFTMSEGSKAPNVIPPSASITANLRLNPEDTIDSALSYIKKTVNNENIKYEVLVGENPSRISRTDVIGWERVKHAVSDTWRGSLVSPYLMVQCADCRHYGRISDRVYRFSAMDLSSEERSLIHGNNERIRFDCARRAVEFYVRLMKEC